MNTQTQQKTDRTGTLKVGDCVRYSGYALKPKRDWWLGRGDYASKNRAKGDLDAMTAKRGEITAFNRSKAGSEFVTVKWYDGSQIDCLTHLVMKA